ncbi:MAG TPA: tetratricopeptide repeat protein [Bryobacteraceae bacterium]|nr:tetratricopeptide repeat protein [Bryobacteraceae bacterium]
MSGRPSFFFKRWPWLLGGVVAAAGLATAGSWLHTRAACAAIRSLAVLPFADSSAQKRPDWFSEGITEEVIDALTRVPGLRVTGRTSAFRVQSEPRDLSKIGAELGVAAVLEGSIRTDGDRLRLTVQMNRAADGYRLWSGTLDRRLQDVFSAGEEMANAIADRIQLGRPSPQAPRHQPPQQALNAYLEGRQLFRRTNSGARNQAVERFEEATRIDPEFARAWAWLSIAQEYRVDYDLARSNEAMPGARDAAERAVTLAPDSGVAHLALAVVKLQYDWDWAGAKQELDRAIQLNPGSAFTMHWRAHWFETQGRLEEAIAEMQRALALDPFSDLLLGDLATEYLAAGKPERALEFAQKAADLNPDSAESRLRLMHALCRAGQRDRARQMAQELKPGAVAPFQLALLAADEGDPSAARDLLDQAEDLHDNQHLPAAIFAELAASVKDWGELFDWLDGECEERSVQLPYARLNPEVPKSDPRFAALLQKMNLPESAAPAPIK